jgi:integrase/recombinase XerD
MMVRRVCGPMVGPLRLDVAGFRQSLAGQGYSSYSIDSHVLLMGHVSRWLVGEGLSASDLTGERARLFLEARRAEGYVHPVSIHGMAPLLGYLREIAAVPALERDVAVTALDVLLGRYRRYLIEERGLSVSTTVPHYLDVARAFLQYCSVADDPDLGALTSADVTGFVLWVSRRHPAGHAKSVTTRLRSFLRYLYVAGLTGDGLVMAVPSVAVWQLTMLPRAISAADVARLLKSCDRRRAKGRRDFAVLTVLVRLGLRAGEVAALRLGDIDWHHGEVTVHGKGNREDRLPLPPDVGDAIVGWLRRGRPRCDCPAVFTRLLAPHRGLSARAVSGIVRQACVRAGVTPVGSHRLRHTVATQTLRAGATLSEVGQLLRQHSLAATSIYAKVDRLALASVVQPWPGGAA